MDNTKIFTLDVELSRKLADCFGWPFGKEPKFTFTRECDGLFGSYDSGLEYETDGHTFEWDFQISHKLN